MLNYYWLIIVLAIFGAGMGSFASCMVWRMRYREKGKKLSSRSQCLNCKKQLKWWENIPLVSWMIQNGKCRNCKKPIGGMEIILETIGLGIFGLISWKFFGGWGGVECGTGYDCGYLMNGLVLGRWRDFVVLDIASLMVLLGFLVVFLMLAAYDWRWGKLPNLWLGILISLALVYAGVTYWRDTLIFNVQNIRGIWDLGMAVGLLGGVYGLLYWLSIGKWVGDGDWLLGIGMGLVLGSGWKALMALFFANLLASIVGIFRRKKHLRIHLAPFLMAGLVIVLLFEKYLIYPGSF